MEQGDLRKTSVVRMRNYGRIVESMVALAAKEQESGIARLKEDILTFSNGVLKCDFPAFDETMQKLGQRAIPFNNNNQKKKKK